jgi:3-phosphoshikimate 1-carboxyvinyltransferase
MGAQIQIHIEVQDPEPLGRLQVTSSQLRAVTITKEEIPSIIDELPLLAIVASQASGLTRVEGAQELRVKESDRIEALAQGLRAMGGKIQTCKDGFWIEGPQSLVGGTIESFHDHRIAMAFSIAALLAEGKTQILDAECVSISYPQFYKILQELTRP